MDYIHALGLKLKVCEPQTWMHHFDMGLCHSSTPRRTSTALLGYSVFPLQKEGDSQFSQSEPKNAAVYLTLPQPSAPQNVTC